MSEPCVVALHDVWTRRGEREVHRGVALCLQRGEILGLVGGSGSGKTTLLRVVLDLDQPGRGTVELFGRSVDALDGEERQQVRNRCGVLFQGGALFSSLDVFDNVAFPLREIRGLDEGMVRPLVLRTLRRVGLDPVEVAGLMPAQLSGGMVTRVALARALVREPELLLLDEPTSGLDPIATGGFIDLILGLHQRLDLTILLVSHDLDTLSQLCHRIVVLADGSIVADGRFEELSRHPHPFVQRLFGGRLGSHPEWRPPHG